MKLEDVSVEVRPRNPWEAVDVGFLLPVYWWRSVYIPWLLFIVPLIVIISILFRSIPWLPALIIWWLKPLYDRLLLSVFSQRLFGVKPTTGSTLRSLPSLFKTGLFTNLTLLRFNPSRSFHLPVWQLEGLRGKQRHARIKVLSARIYSFPLWLTVVCLALEIVIYATLIFGISLLVPYNIALDIFSLTETTGEESLWLTVAVNLLLSMGTLVIEPFYIAAGFMLYINRRIRLEGWDIEIAFRKIGKRLMDHTGSLSLLFVMVFSVYISQPVLAVDNTQPGDAVNSVRLGNENAETMVGEILSREEFNNIKTVTEWRYIGGKKSQNKSDNHFSESMLEIAKLLAVIFKSVLWVFALVLILMIILYRHKWLWLFKGKKKAINEYTPPEQLFGMDISADSLPADIPAAVRNSIEAGNIRQALSLLYRGALMRLVKDHKLELHDGLTEGEIVATAARTMQVNQITYLNNLTREWIQTAYANRLTRSDILLQLCDEWPVLRPLK